MADELVGTTLLGKLRVERRVGAGAFGEVYEAIHVLTGHRRALKILRHDRATELEAVTRFVREARVTSRLACPHIAQVHDAGRLPDGRAYAVMDWLEGRSLRAVLEAEGRIVPERALALVRQAARGLMAVHEAGLLHRDLKPENLFLEETDAGERLKLLDFGLVTDELPVEDALTREGSLLGSPAYMSARRLDGHPAEPRDDVHALGVVLYELLTGRRPFEGATLAALIAASHRGTYPSLAEQGVARADVLQPIVDRALGRGDPLSSADALDRALGELPSSREGDRVDGYAIVRAIARGGMGEIYEVERLRDGQRLAMKILRKDRLQGHRSVERMRREATLAARVAAEHVVPIVDAGTDAVTGAPYLVMELLDGEDLGTTLARGPLEPRRAVEVLHAVAAALDAVHDAGLVHRDVKPENVFVLAPVASSTNVRMLDFGIAALVDGGPTEGASTTASTIVGTPLYLAPEQIDRAHPVSAATDRFALGQLAYSLLVGAPYFQTEASRGLLAIVSALSQERLEPPSIRAARRGRALPDGFDGWFARATAALPSERFGSSGAQVDALAHLLDAPRARGGRSRTAIALALAVFAVAVAGWIARGEATAKPTPPAPSAEVAKVEAPSTPPPETSSADVPSSAPGLPAPTGSSAAAVSQSPPTPSPARPEAAPRPQKNPDEAHDSLF